MQMLKWNGGKFVSRQNTVAFVTFSNGRYLGQEKKLVNSVHQHYPEADVFTFHDFAEIGSPHHLQSPYSFKVYAIEAVRKRGYKIIFWCDSVVRLRMSIDRLLPKIRQVGVYLQSDGWPVGVWANDRALNYFGIARDDAMNIQAIYACIMAFDFDNPIASEFFTRWKKASIDGIFIGNWKNDLKTESQDDRCRGHRHDQTCAELISHQMGIPRNEPLLGEKSVKCFTTHNFP
jgi:hypothetical protein